MRTPCFIALFLCAAVPASAQSAAIHGTVLDAGSGEALIGANVVYSPGKGTATDATGKYRLDLPPGDHVISISSVGYVTQQRTVTLAPGQDLALDVQLTATAAQLDMVVVTAGRFEQRVGEVSQSLSVLRPELVRSKNINTMSDALDQVPGVVIVDEEPQIRSGSGFSFGAGSRVQVLVDDIPILSGDIGRPNWTFLPLENLEQVEVIKGAASVLYGSAALSGVINVRTAYPRSTPSTRVTVFSGVYDTPSDARSKWWDANPPLFGGANFFHSQQFGKLDVVLGGNAFSDAGFVGPEPLHPDSIAADPLRLGPGGYEHRVRFNTGLRWRNAKVKGLSYGVNGNVMKSRSSTILIWNDLEEGFYRPKQGTVTRTLGSQYYVDPFVEYVTAHGMKHNLRGRVHRQEFDNDNDQSNSNTTMHGEYQVQQRVEAFGDLVYTAGLVVRSTTSEAALYSGESDGNNSSSNVAAYLQLDKKFLGRLALSAGLRYEQFRVNEDEASQPVFRAGATYQVLEATFLRASYGQGFRFPTIGERYIRTAVGQLNIYPNPELRPETSWNVEGGVKQGFKIGSFMGYLDAVVFQQEFEDYVEFTFGQWGEFSLPNLFGLGFKSVNTGGARVTGYEFEVTGKGAIGRTEIMLLAGYTHTLPVSTTPEYVYAELPEAPVYIKPPPTYRNTSSDPTGDILKYRVQDLFRADVQANYERFMAGMSVRYNSHVRNIDLIFVELDESTSPVVRLDTGVSEWMRTHRSGDTLLDARVGYELSRGTRIAFIVNNLTNVKYALRPLSAEAMRSMQVQLTVDL